MTDAPAQRPDLAYVDWDGYLRGVYTPAPALVALPEWPLIRTGWGGRGFGFPEHDDRARAAAGGDYAEAEALLAAMRAERDR